MHNEIRVFYGRYAPINLAELYPTHFGSARASISREQLQRCTGYHVIIVTWLIYYIRQMRTAILLTPPSKFPSINLSDFKNEEAVHFPLVSHKQEKSGKV